MKKYLALIVALTMVAAVTTYAKDIRLSMAQKARTTVDMRSADPKYYLFGLQSSAQGWEIVRLAEDSIFKASGMDTTAPDGERYVNPGNTTACPPNGPPNAICTLPSGIYWYGTKDTVTGWHLAGEGAASSPMGLADLTDWPDAVDDTEVGYLDGVTSGIQRQIDNLAVKVADLSAALASAGVDTTPDAFSFADQPDVALSTVITSAPVTVAGISSATSISVTGGSYDINGSGTFVTAAGTVNNNDTVRARHTSAADNATATNTTITIGGVSDTFTSTTVNTPSIGLVNTAVTGQMAGGQANVPSSSGNYFFYSQVQAAGSGTVNYAHWNTYSNGSTNRFHIYSVSGGTATALCSSATQTGTAAQPNVYDTPLSGCTVSEGTTYLVGVCVTSDNTPSNGPYVANPSGIGTSRRVTVANCGDSFATTDPTDTQISTSRVIYAYGNNSATR